MTQAAPTSTYFRHLAEGRFMLQHSPSTGEWVYYPRMVAPKTGATDMVWKQPSGLGTVYATTVKRVKPPAADVNVAIVELDEGPRMMTHVQGIAPDAVRIGMRVRACIVDGPDDAKILVFEPEAAA
ncbi:Zn-ribbon domain-containing OB-fold protein [Novosphingobium sp. AAP83]|uniref:Zn-ribbon domain-containing OB-fold protein n=1 Tax=Novosphingobium sp. AAP83 TaxID=1523425 RepID=UPI0009EA5DCB|nr:OB-fold domain-containing protein [Novosphingobium sp. AAP83]